MASNRTDAAKINVNSIDSAKKETSRVKDGLSHVLDQNLKF